MSTLQQILSSQDSLVITDTETTGLSAHVNQIIELSAFKVRHQGDGEWFSELIDPGVSIPSRITRITGITSSMVFGRPTAAQVMPDYRDFLGAGIFVAHNIGFDTSFINSEFERLGMHPMENRGLCSLRLARRLLPGLRSKSLGNLARFFHISSEGRHRAEVDVEITTEVLERLVQIAIDEHHIDDIQELLELQSRTYSKVNPFSRHVLELKRDVLPGLPQLPGVYYMKDARDRVLYVGKAKILSQRVSSYFTAIEAHPPRLRQLVARVRRIAWEVTETELHALILESRQIKEMDPPLNRAQKKYVPRPYLRLGTGEHAARLTVQVIVRDDGAEYFGPLRSRTQARALVEIAERYFNLRTCSPAEYATGKACVRADIGKCGAPCDGSQTESEYARVISAVISFLEGEIAQVCDHIEHDMQMASQRYAFEEAAQLRDWIELLDERVTKYGSVAAPVSGPDRVHLLKPDEESIGTLAVVSHGRILCIEPFSESTQVQSLVGHILNERQKEGPVMNRIQIDSRRILDHWLFINRKDICSLERRADESVESFSARVMSQV